MTTGFRISTIKHEADTYLSHGLYEEAMSVYENFVASTENLHPDLKKIVDESMQKIRTAAGEINWDRDKPKSAVRVALPIEKTPDNITVTERVTGAQLLAQTGHHERALDEYRRLLKKKYITSAVIKGVAQCLVHLVRPKHIAHVVDNFAKEIFEHPRHKETFKLSIARVLYSERYHQHHSALTVDL